MDFSLLCAPTGAYTKAFRNGQSYSIANPAGVRDMAMEHTAMTTANESKQHAREARLRRLAIKQGLRLEKSRTRTPASPGFGRYRLIDPANGVDVAVDPARTSMDLDQVEAALVEDAA
jgi:hypothetical protein